MGEPRSKQHPSSPCITTAAVATSAKEKSKKAEIQKYTEVLFNVALHDMGNHSKFSDAWIEPIEKARRCRNRQTRRRVRQGKRPRRAVPAFRARSPPRRPTTVRRRGRSEETARIPSASRQLPLVLRLPCNPSRRLVARSRNVGIERNAGVHAVHERVEPIPKIVFVLKGNNAEIDASIDVQNRVANGIKSPAVLVPNGKKRKKRASARTSLTLEAMVSGCRAPT